LRSGGVIKDGKGIYKRFDPKRNQVVSYSQKHAVKSLKGFKPLWDSECQIAVDFRKKYYREFLKNLSNVLINKYRKAYDARTVIKKKGRL